MRATFYLYLGTRHDKGAVGRPVVAIFNTERIVARAWPASENRIAVAELTY